jgi:hypothetical protein
MFWNVDNEINHFDSEDESGWTDKSVYMSFRPLVGFLSMLIIINHFMLIFVLKLNYIKSKYSHFKSRSFSIISNHFIYPSNPGIYLFIPFWTNNYILNYFSSNCLYIFCFIICFIFITNFRSFWVIPLTKFLCELLTIKSKRCFNSLYSLRIT